MNQRGFLLSGITLYAAIAMAAVIGVLGLSLWFTSLKLDSARKELSRVEGEYAAFKGEAARLGKVAQDNYDKRLKDSERNSNERIKSLGLRVAAATARADSLCKSAGLSAGCRALSTAPSTTRPVDDQAHNQRLVELLRHAQEVTDRLIELQLWVAAQQVAQP